jgi:hypothetical protein
MAKGRVSLLESTDLPVIETEIEEGTLPFFLIEDDYGIAADKYCYMLCERKKASRTIKNENGEPDHVETYFLWNSIKYLSSFKRTMECYIEINGRKMNARKIKNTTFKDIIDNQNEIKRIVSEALKTDGVNKEFVSFCDLADKKEELLKEIEEVRVLKKTLSDESEALLEFIKEKRRLIITNTEPKKHRVKTEE